MTTTTILADVSVGVANHSITVATTTTVQVEPSTTDVASRHVAFTIPLGDSLIHTTVMDVETAALEEAIRRLRSAGVLL